MKKTQNCIIGTVAALFIFAYAYIFYSDRQLYHASSAETKVLAGQILECQRNDFIQFKDGEIAVVVSFARISNAVYRTAADPEFRTESVYKIAPRVKGIVRQGSTNYLGTCSNFVAQSAVELRRIRSAGF